MGDGRKACFFEGRPPTQASAARLLLGGGRGAGVFDRVLADVPCSGDGTLRKQPSIWRSWTLAGGLGLHPLQLLITLRGAAMLKVRGDALRLPARWMLWVPWVV